MAAMVLKGHGGFDQLQWEGAWPTPEPGPGEVLIQVGACGLNNTDINTRTAWYAPEVEGGITESVGQEGLTVENTTAATWGGEALSFPRIQGADVAGRIVTVGAGIAESRIGERVLCDPWIFRGGQALYLGSELDGGFAEYCAVPAENAHALETSLSDAELAAFPCALSTAENLVAKTNLQPGERVAISGASGGVGAYAVQLCKLRGAHVTALASPSKHATLQALGADAVLDRDGTGLGEIDVALDVVGQGIFDTLIEALRTGGRYSTSGAIAGAQVDFDLRQLIYKDLQFTGATIIPVGTFARLIRLIETGKLQANLAATFPLQDLVAAQEAFLSKAHAGKIVVTCA